MKTNAGTTRFSMHFNPSEILHFGQGYICLLMRIISETFLGTPKLDFLRSVGA
jgi:hypothetical protein